MKRTIIHISMSFWLVCSYSYGLAQRAPSEGVNNKSIFTEILPILLQKTQVPLRLPQYVRYLGDKENPLYSSLTRTGMDDYSIELSLTKDCDGSHWCHWGFIQGSKTPLASQGRPEI